MCGIAGLIHRGKESNVGGEMTKMLQSLKHRGPDSTGFAVYGQPEIDEFVMRFKVAEQEDLASGFSIHHQIRERREERRARVVEQRASRQRGTRAQQGNGHYREAALDHRG